MSSKAWNWLRPHIRPRRPATLGEWAAAAAAAVFTALLLLEALRALIELVLGHWYLTATAILVPVGFVAGRWRWKAVIQRRRAERLAHLRLDLVMDIDRLDPTAFEYAVRDLMIRDGIGARRVGGAGDRAADVIGRGPGGRVIVVQCKHTLTQAKVGAKVIYQVNGTAEHAHGADDAIVVTNGSFTSSAVKYAAEVGIHLIDRDGLRAWAQEGVALHELLKLRLDDSRWRRQRGRLRRHRRRGAGRTGAARSRISHARRSQG
ncbi:restriction endonuclease [Nonomuraea indica]|uniref:restriction endonuclease n=1 Tax=Nonomuraea indica TaxID=1581193 RepID=UPI000C7CC124|nr:restriction endonuclease [Nonomuraea indica]